MVLSLQTYRPFDCFRAAQNRLRELGNNEAAGWKEQALKAGKIALQAILIVAALIADFALIPPALAFQAIKGIKEADIQPNHPIIPPLPTQVLPSPQLTEQALAHPYPQGLPQGADGIDEEPYFRHAVESSLEAMNPAKADYFRQLLAYGGMDEEGNPGDHDIYRWAAECSVIQAALCMLHGENEIPLFIREGLERAGAIHDLAQELRALPRRECAALVLKARAPDSEWSLRPALKQVINRVHALGQTLSMSQRIKELHFRAYPIQ